MNQLIDILRFSVAEGHRQIVGAGQNLTDSIFIDIARRVEAVADHHSKSQETAARSGTRNT